MKTNERKGYQLIFLAGVLWGIIGIFVKQLESNGANIETTSFVRVAFAFFIMAIFCLMKYGVRGLYVEKGTLFICAMLGIICHGIYNICYSAAVTSAGVTISAVLLDVAPAVTLLCSMVLFCEKLTIRKLIAIAINIMGCILTVTNGKLDVRQLEIVGILFGIGAGIAYSLTAIIGKFVTDKTNSFVMSMYSYFFATLFLGLWSKPWSQACTLTINKGILIWGFLYALIPTAIAYVIYYQGIQKIKESSKVPVIASIEIIIATLVGVLLYSEQLGAVSIVGIVFVLLSILCMS